MKVRQTRPRPARIEMLPLIDIIFLLLVVFIYAMLTMAVQQGLVLELPISSTAEESRRLLLPVSFLLDQ